MRSPQIFTPLSPFFRLSFPSHATIKRQSDDGRKERQFYILAGISPAIYLRIHYSVGWCSGAALSLHLPRAVWERALLSRNESLRVRSFDLHSPAIPLPTTGHRAFFSSGIHFERADWQPVETNVFGDSVSLFIGEPAGKLTDANNTRPAHRLSRSLLTLARSHFDLNTSA